MALAKRVKVGGSHYHGYKLTVSGTTGDYILDMICTDAAAVNGITIVPDAYGAGDHFKLEHLNANAGVVSVLAETVYNVGANAAWLLDFASLELMDANDKFRLTYTNVASTGMTVYTSVERIK